MNSIDDMSTLMITLPELDFSEIRLTKRLDEAYNILSSLYNELLEYKKIYHFLK